MKGSQTSFNRKQNVSRYFIVCTVTMPDCIVGYDLLELRRELVWENAEMGDYFHATSDKQAVRDRVFKRLELYDFSIQATIMEKSKSQPHIRTASAKFYKYGWFYHFKHRISPKLLSDDEVHIVAEAIGTKKIKASFKAAVHEVIQQHLPRERWRADMCSPMSDPCLQVADYCSWAIQRKWEHKDNRSYNLIRDRITDEFDLWRHGDKHYY